MRTPYLLFFAVLLFMFGACQQTPTPTPATNTNNFIEFDENGTTVRHELTLVESVNTISPMYDGTINYQLVNSSYSAYNGGNVESFTIGFSSSKPQLGLSEYQSLIGQKLALGVCSGNNCVQGFLSRAGLSGGSTSDASVNSLPNDYIKITAVQYDSNDPNYGDLFEIKGEFSATLLDTGNNTNKVTNGKFQLLFQGYN